MEDGVDHFGFYSGEYTETGYVCCVEVFLDLELCDAGWAYDKWPVDCDAEPVYFGERIVVWRGEGFECRGGDFGRAIAAV